MELLPSAEPVRFIEADGTPVARRGMPGGTELRAAYRALVLGRRFEQQATALVKQGQLAVYPSAHGQEAAEVGAVLALRPTDWIFPTYRDSVALLTRGVDAVEILTLLRGGVALRLRPVRAPRRAAVHAARHPGAARGGAGLRRAGAG